MKALLDASPSGIHVVKSPEKTFSLQLGGGCLFFALSPETEGRKLTEERSKRCVQDAVTTDVLDFLEFEAIQLPTKVGFQLPACNYVIGNEYLDNM